MARSAKINHYTVGSLNPAPPGMYKALQIAGQTALTNNCVITSVVKSFGIKLRKIYGSIEEFRPGHIGIRTAEATSQVPPCSKSCSQCTLLDLGQSSMMKLKWPQVWQNWIVTLVYVSFTYLNWGYLGGFPHYSEKLDLGETQINRLMKCGSVLNLKWRSPRAPCSKLFQDLNSRCFRELDLHNSLQMSPFRRIYEPI